MVVTPIAGSVQRLAASEHGVAFTTLDNLVVVRPGQPPTTIAVSNATCPWPESDRFDIWEETHVLADRVLFVRPTCGIWAYTDGDPSPQQIVERWSKPKETATTDENVHPPDELDVRFRWQGGPGPTFDALNGRLAVATHNGRLFVCLTQGLDPRHDPTSGQIWSLPLDGTAAPEQVAELGPKGGIGCDALEVDDAAFYARNVLGIFRIDRATKATTELTKSDLFDNITIEDMKLTSSHVYWLSNDRDARKTTIRRVLRTGGAIETIEGAMPTTSSIEGDGQRIYAVQDDDILKVDGLGSTTALMLHDSYPRFTVSRGDIFWVRSNENSGAKELVQTPAR